MPIDPVCKMHIDISDAAASFDYHTETVYFCSIDCLKNFEADPGRYIQGLTDEEKIAS